MGISDIESVVLRRPPLGRLLGYGTVVVVGRGGTPFNLAFLPEPERLHRGILDLRSEQQHRPAHAPPREEPPDDSRYMPKG